MTDNCSWSPEVQDGREFVEDVEGETRERSVTQQHLEDFILQRRIGFHARCEKAAHLLNKNCFPWGLEGSTCTRTFTWTTKLFLVKLHMTDQRAIGTRASVRGALNH